MQLDRRSQSSGCFSNAKAPAHGLFAVVLAVVTSGLLALSPPALATDKCGEVGGENWTVAESPYVVTDTCGTAGVTVALGTTLTIDASVEVQFWAATSLQVSGTLEVNGESGSEVVLTSDAAVPAAGDWLGLQLRSSSTSTIDYATITYADSGIQAYDSSTATLTGVASRLNNYGLYIYGNGPPVVSASGCSFTENATYGVWVQRQSGANPAPTITGSSLHSNLGGYDFFAGSFADSSETTVDVRGNWWGSSDPAVIGPRIYGHRQSINSPLVDWCGYLASAGGSPAVDVHCPELSVCNETVVWDLTDKPYQLVTDVIVCPTGTLQVESGVEVRTVLTSPQPDFLVQGSLDVNGTVGNAVTFTSDAISPAAGDWRGLRLESSSVSTIDNAEITYASLGIDAAESSTATLTGVASRLNNYGLYIYGNGPPVVSASGCSFTENATYGVWVQRQSGANPAPTITGSSLHSNLGGYDFFAGSFADSSETVLRAPDNWWGTEDDEEIRQRIHDHGDSSSSPRVWFKLFGPSCEITLGRDTDGDRHGDFDDNCPVDANPTQIDTDGDRMGDACDPEPGVQPAGPCNGIDDIFDGYADADADGWGDPCDFQPTRDDSYPGAPEICDGRDNDGDALFSLDELSDADLDGAITCGDCDDAEPEVYPCACESCINLREDDCDGLMDGADPECFENPYCVVVTANTPEPDVHVDKGACGGANLSGPFDVIRGQGSQLQLSGGSVDLGNVHCVEGSLDWDRVTDVSADPNPVCNDRVLYFLARDSGAGDFGSAYPGSESRDVMNPDPVCP